MSVPYPFYSLKGPRGIKQSIYGEPPDPSPKALRRSPFPPQWSTSISSRLEYKNIRRGLVWWRSETPNGPSVGT